MPYSKPAERFHARFLSAIFVVGCLAIPASYAWAGTACSSQTSAKAERTLVDARVDWTSLYKHWHVYAICDDGGIGEGYSDAVVSLLAEQWSQLHVFMSISKADPAFQRWALHHVDATSSDKDLTKIILNSKKSCPHDVSAQRTCARIGRAALAALKDLRSGANQ